MDDMQVNALCLELDYMILNDVQLFPQEKAQDSEIWGNLLRVYEDLHIRNGSLGAGELRLMELLIQMDETQVYPFNTLCERFHDHELV